MLAVSDGLRSSEEVPEKYRAALISPWAYSFLI
jgi:hypothetical protein